MTKVEVGQVWQDRDKRMNGRTVRVLEIEMLDRWMSRYAGIGGTEKVPVALCQVGVTLRRTRIAVERMERQQGWKLLRHADGTRVEIPEVVRK